MQSVRAVLLLAVTSFTLPGTALAAVPSPANSTVDECIRVCPAGDMNLHVVVRDAFHNPVVASFVVVNFTNCFSQNICPTLGSEPYTFIPPASIQMVTNAAGEANIPIRSGGVCVASATVSADGVLLATRVVASPDQNGDAVVNATDQALMALKLTGPFAPEADLNCSGSLEIGDPGILDAHLGHSCQMVVPVTPRSWGTIKIRYR
jgi:hypothetical protein